MVGGIILLVVEAGAVAFIWKMMRKSERFGVLAGFYSIIISIITGYPALVFVPLGIALLILTRVTRNYKSAKGLLIVESIGYISMTFLTFILNMIIL